MTSFFFKFLMMSFLTSFSILILHIIRKLTKEHYTKHWCYYVSLLIAVRLLIPVCCPIINIPIPHQSSTQLSQKQDSFQEDKTTSTYSNNTLEKETISTYSEDAVNTKEQALNSPQRINHAKENLATTLLDSPTTYQNSKGIINIIHYFSMNLLSILAFVWLGITILYAIYELLQYFAFWSVIKRWSSANTDEMYDEIFFELKEELQVRKNVSLLISKIISSPMAVGILHPTIILPYKDYSDEQLEVILRHELIHIQSRHLYAKFILLIAKIFHWFNPFVHLLIHNANEDMEFLCDDAVIKDADTAYKQLYSMTILETLLDNQHIVSAPVSTYFNGGKNDLKNRFQTIMTTTMKKRGVILFSLLAITLGIVSITSFTSKNPKVVSLEASQIDSTPKVSATTTAPEKKELTTKSFLIVGTDGNYNDTINYADSTILITIVPDKKKIITTSIERNLYLGSSKLEPNKLSCLYPNCSVADYVDLIEEHMNLSIEGTLEVNYKCFEKIINALDGIEISLTKDESEYLNTTNYISHKKYRTTKPGKQLLNGSQALGYARLRFIKSADGQFNEFGRTYRWNQIFDALYANRRNTSLEQYFTILNIMKDNITTTVSANDLKELIKVLLNDDYELITQSTPTQGECEGKIEKKISVIVADLKKTSAYLLLHEYLD